MQASMPFLWMLRGSFPAPPALGLQPGRRQRWVGAAYHGFRAPVEPTPFLLALCQYIAQVSASKSLRRPLPRCRIALWQRP